MPGRMSKPIGTAVAAAISIVAVILMSMKRHTACAACPTTQPVEEYQSIDIGCRNAVWSLKIRPDGSGHLIFGAAMGRDVPEGTYDYKGLRARLHEGHSTGFPVSFQPSTVPFDENPANWVEYHPSPETTLIRALYDIAFSAPPIKGYEKSAKDVKEWLKTNPLLPPRRKTQPTTQQILGCHAIRIYGDNDLNLLLCADGSGALYMCKRGEEVFPGSDNLDALPEDEWEAVFVETMRSPSAGKKRGVTFPVGTFDFSDVLHNICEESGPDSKATFIPADSGFKNISPATSAAEVKKVFDDAFHARPGELKGTRGELTGTRGT